MLFLYIIIFLKVRNIYYNLKEGLRTSKGRNILTFFIFLAISTVFWFLLALNDDIQKDYHIPVVLDGFPEDLTLLSGYDPSLNVTVKDKGSSLIRYEWGNTPTIKLRYDDFKNTSDSILIFSGSQLNSALRGVFGTAASIVSIKPDSLKFAYTTNPAIKVAVSIDCDIHTQPQYAYGGHPLASVDSILLFSNSPDRYKIHSISTKPIILGDLADTTEVTAILDVPGGMRAVPSTISVKFPVEPLVAKKQSVPVEVINVPMGQKIVTFPSITEVSYLIPKSMYNMGNAHIRATVDYNDIHTNETSLYISLSKLPAYFRNPSLSPDHVEYVIERID